MVVKYLSNRSVPLDLSKGNSSLMLNPSESDLIRPWDYMQKPLF